VQLQVVKTPRGAPSSSRDPRQLFGQLLGFSLLTLGSDFGERLLEGLPLPTELGDPLGDQLGLDPILQGLDLRLDLAVELGDLVADSRAGDSRRR
jgi:hypothetical protein